MLSSRAKDITGIRFGRLVAKRFLGKDKNQNAIWLCLCDCGSETTATTGALTCRHKQSCGCLVAERAREAGRESARHGKKGSGVYRSWEGMIHRCTNSNSKKYEIYGGRGITVCDRWRDFVAFYEDMGDRPDGKTLDRIDVNGNYEPGNCRWATATEQTRNRRPVNSKTGVDGVYWKKQAQKYQARIFISKRRVSLGHYADFFEAVCARKSAEADRRRHEQGPAGMSYQR